MDYRPAKRRRIAEPQHAVYHADVRKRQMHNVHRRDGTAIGRRAVVSIVENVDAALTVVVAANDDGVAIGTSTVTADPGAVVSIVVGGDVTTTPSVTSTLISTPTSTSSSTPTPTSTSSRTSTTSTSASPAKSTTPTPVTSTTPSLTTTPLTTTTSSESGSLTTSDVVSTNTSSTSLQTSTTTFSTLTPFFNSTIFSNSTLGQQYNFKNTTTTSIEEYITSTTTVDPSTSAAATSDSQPAMITYTSTVMGAPVAAAAPTSGTGGTASRNNDNSNNSNNNQATPIAPPPVIAGAVTGSVGAAAIIAVILLLLLRWYRKRLDKQSVTLTGGERFLKARPGSSNGSGPAMMQDRSSFLPAAAAAFISRHRHQKGSAQPTLPNVEPSFQKVQGRKIPSQFGHDAVEAPMFRDFDIAPTGGSPTLQNGRTPLHRSMFSDHSVYKESRQSRGRSLDAASLMNPFGDDAHDYTRPDRETVMPSPARTPVVQQGTPVPEQGMYFLPPPGAYRDTYDGRNLVTPSPPGTPQMMGYSPEDAAYSGSSYSDPARRVSRFAEVGFHRTPS